MPAPAVYIIAVIGGIAATVAFKEFVYDPHIAPKVEEWRQELQERNRARRRRAVDVSVGHSSYEPLHEEAVEMQPRSSSPFGGLLRRRGTARVDHEDGQELSMYPQMVPTHVIAASSGSATPATVTSVLPSRSHSPTPSVETLRSPTQSHTVFDAMDDEDSPLSSPGAISPESTAASMASRHIPSLSLSYDHRAHDEELVEAPSSPSSLGESDELFMSFASPSGPVSTTTGDGFETAMSPFDSPVRVLSPARSPTFSHVSDEGLRSPHFTGSDFSDFLDENGSEMSWTSARVNSDR